MIPGFIGIIPYFFGLKYDSDFHPSFFDKNLIRLQMPSNFQNSGRSNVGGWSKLAFC